MEGFEELLGVNFWTALFVLLNTLAIFFVAKKFLFKPVMKIIKDRQDEIDGMYQAAGDAKKQAEAMRGEYQQKLTAAQQTSERIVKEAVSRGQAREEEILRKANADAAAIMDKASADIALEKKKAINDAKDEISDLAMAIAGKVVGRELNEADQKDLIDRFIDNLGDHV
ncbi:MAG: F0F1 ATP synthase subunit B [Clostridiales bacterium]|nr:F0F1 ATP synthase subunit B [Clostridiales bacterium]MDD7387200.1 F0F1 ATP synthase subunit B [Bacillota bacterium]MDY6040747.1 F0F1 ATP synthase subunit B [Candidatus Faecousia sp.]